jgi:hypothetical protein
MFILLLAIEPFLRSSKAEAVTHWITAGMACDAPDPIGVTT